MTEINRKKRFSFTLPIRFLCGLLAFAGILAVTTVRYERFAGKRHYGDFHVYYVTGNRLLNGLPIYVSETNEITPFKYSPLAASFFSVLAKLPEKTAAGTWHVLNISFLFASVWMSLQLIKRRFSLLARSAVRIGFLGILGVSPPIIHCLNSGQVGLVILFLFMLGVHWTHDGEEMRGSFFFALSAMFKFLPLLILPYFLFSGRRRFVFLFMAWLVFFHLLPAAWLGWDRNWNDLKGFLPFLSATTLDHGSLLDFKNQSVWAYAYRLIFYDLGFFKIQDHPEWLAAVGLGFLAVLYALIFFSRAAGRGDDFLIDSAALGILIVIFNPNAWKHNFVLLLFPYLVFLASVFSSPRKGWKAGILILVFLLLMMSNRALIGWNFRFELMSLSNLFLAAFALFAGLIFLKEESRRSS